MGNREKFEIPTIEFTMVTLLDTGANSSCPCVKKTDCPDVWTVTAVNPGCTNDCPTVVEGEE